MTLAMAPSNVPLKIVRYKNNCDLENQSHLQNLGFIEGSVVTVVTENQGNLIVSIKNSRIALGKDIATKILVSL